MTGTKDHSRRFREADCYTGDPKLDAIIRRYIHYPWLWPGEQHNTLASTTTTPPGEHQDDYQ